MDSYLDALEREIEFAAVKFAGRHLNSIYIGGGTPTTLEPYQLDRLIRKIKCSFDLSDCLEFTVEAEDRTALHTKAEGVETAWNFAHLHQPADHEAGH